LAIAVNAAYKTTCRFCPEGGNRGMLGGATPVSISDFRQRPEPVFPSVAEKAAADRDQLGN